MKIGVSSRTEQVIALKTQIKNNCQCFNVKNIFIVVE
jgi:hypothetical protein